MNKEINRTDGLRWLTPFVVFRVPPQTELERGLNAETNMWTERKWEGEVVSREKELILSWLCTSVSTLFGVKNLRAASRLFEAN